MLRHRQLHKNKRAQNAAGPGGLLDSLKPSALDQHSTPSAVQPSTSPAAGSTATPAQPTSEEGSNPQTIDSPTTSAAPTIVPFPFPLTISHSSSSPTPTLGSSLSASSSILTASSVISTPSTPNSLPAISEPSITTRVVTGASFTPLASSSSPSATSTGSSKGTNTGAIVGGIAGTLAGIAILGFLLMWCMRRQRNRDVDDDFDAQAFRRQSAVLLDDPVEPPRSYNPRPPTMIEHHNVSPALAAQAGNGGQNIYGGYGGYGQQPPYASPEMAQPPPPQAYGAPPMGYVGYNGPQQQQFAGYDPQQALVRQPSDATYLTRQPSSTVGYAPPTAPPVSRDPNAHYIDLNRSSASPYQAAQYADVSHQLGASEPRPQFIYQSSELPDDPLPSPFDDPVKSALAPAPAALSHAHPDHPSDRATPAPATMAPAPQAQGNATGSHSRPVTVYHEDDAYGGI